MVHRFSCFEAHGSFLGQGSNPCLLHWQAGSLPLSPREVQDIFIPHMSVIGWSSLQSDNKEANFSFFRMTGLYLGENSLFYSYSNQQHSFCKDIFL